MASIDEPGSGHEGEESFLDWDGRATLFDDEEELDAEPEEEDELDEEPAPAPRRGRRIRMVDPEEPPIPAEAAGMADLDEKDEEDDDDDDDEEEDDLLVDDAATDEEV